MRACSKSLAVAAAALACHLGVASAASVFTETLKVPMPQAQKEVRSALQSHHMKVVMTIDILKKIKAKQKVLHMANFNQPGFSDVRAMVFCNPVLFNQLLDSDWKDAAVCPLTLTLFSKDNVTHVAFAERSAYTAGGPAQDAGQRVDKLVISSLKSIPGSSS